MLRFKINTIYKKEKAGWMLNVLFAASVSGASSGLIVFRPRNVLIWCGNWEFAEKVLRAANSWLKWKLLVNWKFPTRKPDGISSIIFLIIAGTQMSRVVFSFADFMQNATNICKWNYAFYADITNACLRNGLALIFSKYVSG